MSEMHRNLAAAGNQIVLRSGLWFRPEFVELYDLHSNELMRYLSLNKLAKKEWYKLKNLHCHAFKILCRLNKIMYCKI